MTASVLALLLNLNGNGDEPVRPDDLNPFAPDAGPRRPQLSAADSMDLLRSITLNSWKDQSHAEKK